MLGFACLIAEQEFNMFFFTDCFFAFFPNPCQLDRLLADGSLTHAASIHCGGMAFAQNNPP